MYFLFSISLFWFPTPAEPPCGLEVVECYEESREYVRDEFNKEGLDGEYALKIVDCESRFRADAVSPTDDYGYFQWNKHWWPEIVNECFRNPEQLACEVKYAVSKVKRDKGFSAWSCSRKIK